MTAPTLSDVHRRHIDDLRGLSAIIDGEGLRIGLQYVMFFAEADLMGKHVAALLDGLDCADVLEVGLGLGVFAEHLLRLDINSYTAIEPHQGVASLAHHRVLHKFDGRAHVITQPWQLVPVKTASLDAIMYDTWPPDGHADTDFAIFVEQVAVPSLRPGGRFSFFVSGDVLSDARRDVLDRHFDSWNLALYTMPLEKTPVHWTKPTREFRIPIARKGGT
jgi:spermidine synthase